jgi:type IV secretory pathway VirJ component
MKEGFGKRSVTVLGCALLAACALTAPSRMPMDREVADLPLIEVPAAELLPGAPLAIILSGDGGWSGRMRDLTEELGRHGISTVGWNSLRYYWRERPPDEGAADLARVVDHYRRAWGAGPVVLVGYSWGADVLPALVNRLPAAMRAEVAEVAVIGYSGRENFEFHIASWLGQQVGRSDPANPEIRRLALDGVPILCVNGVREDERGCEGLSARALRVLLLPTGHRFNGYMDEIGERIAAGAVPRAPLREGLDSADVATQGPGSGD